MRLSATALPTGTWNVDPSHSLVGFRVKHLGISTVRGVFREFDGQLVIGEDGSATASGSAQVESIDTGEADRDGHLKSADFFDSASNPEITFRSTSITALDEDTYAITGELTMHGVTITLKAEVGTGPDQFGGERVGLEVSGEISRGDYGMRFNQALGTGNAVVSDKVRLDLDIDAVKQA